MGLLVAAVELVVVEDDGSADGEEGTLGSVEAVVASVGVEMISAAAVREVGSEGGVSRPVPLRRAESWEASSFVLSSR